MKCQALKKTNKDYFFKSNRLLNQGFHFLCIHTTIFRGHSANWKKSASHPLGC